MNAKCYLSDLSNIQQKPSYFFGEKAFRSLYAMYFEDDKMKKIHLRLDLFRKFSFPVM